MATVSITNNDSDENPYSLVIQGTGFQPASSGGGGGGGGSVTEDSYTTSLRSAIGESGILFADVAAQSLDNMCRLYLPTDTLALNRNGVFLTYITITTITEPPEPQEYLEIVGYAYKLEPEGSTFDPPVTLAFVYDATALHEGVSEDNLFIAYWDEDAFEWLAMDSVMNAAEDVVTTEISHISMYALMAEILPAEFSIADLSIAPGAISEGGTVTISVTITNTGDLSGSYTAVLKIDDAVKETKEITLDGGTSQKVSFTVTMDTAGEYAVDVNGLPGEFTVKAPALEGEAPEAPIPREPAPSAPAPSEEEPVTPTPPETVEAPVQEIPEEPTAITWGMWGGIIAAVVVIGGLLAYFLWWRRRTAW
jgi:hypothetical protein